jgi:endonuclease-3
MLKIPVKTIEKLIFPTGFYRRKAQQLHDISQELIDRFGGKVPGTFEKLISLKGVGHKTANLVLGVGFGIPAICVDVHVHRISNRLGIIKTKTVEETEEALKAVVPKKYWIEWNHLLVQWGQNICVPISPLCSQCVIYDLCERVGVKKRR